MSYCPNCGAEVSAGMRFCSACGNALAASTPTAQYEEFQSPAVYDQNTAATSYDTEYRVILVSTGTCQRSYADDVLEDLLGYTNSESNQILSLLPTEIAQGMTREQAVCLAQALSEYGMQVSICDHNGYVNLDTYATESVYDSSGSFLSSALKVLGSLTLANRVSRFVRWNRTNPLQFLFAPRYTKPAPPPVHRRRTLFRRPEPAPRRPVEHPQPARQGGMTGMQNHRNEPDRRSSAPGTPASPHVSEKRSDGFGTRNNSMGGRTGSQPSQRSSFGSQNGAGRGNSGGPGRNSGGPGGPGGRR